MILRALEKNDRTLLSACNSIVRDNCYFCKYADDCNNMQHNFKEHNVKDCWYPISTEKLLQMIADNWNE